MTKRGALLAAALVLAAFGCQISARADERGIGARTVITGDGHLVDYEYVNVASDGTFGLPSWVPFWAEGTAWRRDDDGLPVKVTSGGAKLYNISRIAFEALDTISQPPLGMMDVVAGRRDFTPVQKASLDWLLDHAQPFSEGGLIWRHEFDLNYNNIYVEKGWPSAYTQASIIHAFLVAEQITGDDVWLDRSLAAARAYLVGVDEGGLTSRTAGGPFFEELPLPGTQAPHILNGHLYSLVMLEELRARTGSTAFDALLEEAHELTGALLARYDLGYWSRYDLQPRFHDIPFQFVPMAGRSAELSALSVQIGNKPPTSIPLQDDRSSPNRVVFHGPGWTAVDGVTRTIDDRGAYLQLSLPELAETRATSEEPITVRTRFVASGGVARLGVLGVRDGRAEYAALPVRAADVGREIELDYELRLSDLVWSPLTTRYHDWHVRLLESLEKWQPARPYGHLARRWRTYLERQVAVADLENARMESSILAALDGGTPLEVATSADSEPAPMLTRIYEPGGPVIDAVQGAEYLDQALIEAPEGHEAEAARSLGHEVRQFDLITDDGNTLEVLQIWKQGGWGSYLPDSDRWIADASGDDLTASAILAVGYLSIDTGGQPRAVMREGTKLIDAIYIPDRALDGSVDIVSQTRTSDSARVVEASSFHDGHGPETILDGDRGAGYLAAVEDSFPNRFIIETDQSMSPNVLEIGWNAPDQYATEFALYGIGPGGNRDLLIARDRHNSGGSVEESFAIDARKDYRRFEFVAANAVGQPRLLMTHFRLLATTVERVCPDDCR